MKRCPRCPGVKLEPNEVEGTNIQLDCCPACQGLWFDGGELETLLKDLAVKDIDTKSLKEKSDRACPCCRLPLKSFNYPQTYAKVEICEKCKGIWLDAGEFKEISMVRRNLKQQNQLETETSPGGFKGAVLDIINSTISGLMKF